MTIPAPTPSDGKNNVSDLEAQEERGSLPQNEATTYPSQPEQPTSVEGSHNNGIEQESEGDEGEGQGAESELEPNYGDNFYAGGARGEAEERKTKHWTESPFAVGCVNVTWQDDIPSAWWSSRQAARDIDKNYPVTSIVCSCLGADRVGNFAVLAQSAEEYDDPEVDPASGEVVATHRKKRPKLLWVCGPYWTVNVCITFPLIMAVSGFIAYRRVFAGAHYAVQITWVVGTCFLLGSLAMISCRNPGILYRHSQPPPGTEEDWRWNDQARTYRPSKARFDPECQAVIEGFDHTCPWTGTAIGSRNMLWFKMFVVMIPVMIVYNVILGTIGFLF